MGIDEVGIDKVGINVLPGTKVCVIKECTNVVVCRAQCLSTL